MSIADTCLSLLLSTWKNTRNKRFPVEEDAYSGRWVARLRGRIIAQGGTPGQARQAALSRYKEIPEILYMPASHPFRFPPFLEKILAALPEDQAIYLVGGAVRDLLLNRESHDFDFTLAEGGIKTARIVARNLKADFYPLDAERDTGRVLAVEPNGSTFLVDFAAYRGPDLDADLMGRDFTMNAIALDLRTRQVFDPLGGGMDIRNKNIRTCSPGSFPDDPVRILRAVRFAADLGFTIEKETRQGMKKNSSLLAGVSAERVRDELFRILEGKNPSACLQALDMLGALAVILPELSAMKGVPQPAPHQQDVWGHVMTILSTLDSVLGILSQENQAGEGENLYDGLLKLRIGIYHKEISGQMGSLLAGARSQRGLLFLAALFHDVAKPQTRKVDEAGQLRFWDHDQQGAELVGERARLLALSNNEITRLQTIIRNHMRILFHISRLEKDGKSPSRRAIYRFFRDTGQAGVDLCLLALADLRATYGPTLPQKTWMAALDVTLLLLENWFEKPAESIAPPPLLDGNDLMAECHLEPGPRIGELLEAIREAQAMGEVSTREQAFALARKLLG